MAIISVSLKGGKQDFLPGDAIEGTVAWEQAEGATAIEARLITVSSSMYGKGDTTIAERARIEAPASGGSAGFRFAAPEGMPSFHAKVVARSWGVEAEAEPSGESCVEWIHISPSGKTVMMSPNPYLDEAADEP